MVSNPVVSSMRSRQTGHVGSSISEGVGGARGLAVRVDATVEDCEVDVTLPGTDVTISLLDLAGVKGSLVISGNDELSETWLGVRNSTDLMKTTWQFSACKR